MRVPLKGVEATAEDVVVVGGARGDARRGRAARLANAATLVRARGLVTAQIVARATLFVLGKAVGVLFVHVGEVVVVGGGVDDGCRCDFLAFERFDGVPGGAGTATARRDARLFLAAFFLELASFLVEVGGFRGRARGFFESGLGEAQS